MPGVTGSARVACVVACDLDAAFLERCRETVAQFGNPERLRATLEALGFVVDLRPRPDHHVFSVADLTFSDTLPVVITAKDAVKCEAIASPQTWVLDVVAELAEAGWEQLLDKIDNVI